MIKAGRQLLQRFSLRVQTILLMVLIGTILSASISYSVYLLDIGNIDEEISRRSRGHSQMIQKLSLDAIIAADRPALQTITDGLSALDLGLDEVRITDFDGKILASWSSEDESETQKYCSIYPILYRGRNFGSLELSWNRETVAAPMTARATGLAHTVVFSIAALGFCFVVFVEYYFIKPLSYLKRKMEAFDTESVSGYPHQEFVSGELKQLEQSLDEAVRMVRVNTAKEKELQAEKAKVKVAEGAAAARSEFLSLMSHEIRTPLGAILGFAQLMESTHLNREQVGYVSQIRKSGAFLLTILNDILDLSKIEANKVELHHEPFDLESLMVDLHSMSSPQAGNKGLEFSIKVESEAHLVLRGDAHRLQQVLMNLCGNAIKFTESGEVRVIVSPRIRGGEKGKIVHIRFVVSDTGIGMTQEQAERIFEPFSQADASITRRFGGTGLGVSISRELVAMMGGSLVVETEEGVGSSFSFDLELPLETVRTAKTVRGRGASGKHKQQGDLERLREHHRILVAEDDPANQLLIGKILSCLDQEVVFAGDGQECLDVLAKDSEFDAVLLDLRMPRVSGIEVLQRVRGRELGGRCSRIPIAIMSADVLSKDEAMRLGASEFVMKPIEIGKLREFLSGIGSREEMPARGRVIPFPGLEEPINKLEREEPAGDDAPVVMIAEDNAAVRNLMKKLLEKWGYRVGLAADGEECLRELSVRHYDAVVSDLRMPKMDGFTLISKIREGIGGEDHRDTVIALMTAEVISEEECLEAKANALITKPIPMEDLKRFLDMIPRESGSVSLSG